MRPSAAAAKRVLVLGDYRQTITVVRSLARAGFEVILGTDDPRSSTALSRHVSATWNYDRSSAERFRQQLEAFIRIERPAFVFTVGESQLRRLIREPARFEPLSCWAMPDAETIAQCFDKRAMYALTSQLGIPTLAWHEFTSADDWRRQAAAMGFPVVIKRKDSSAQVRNRKALILREPEELDAFLADVASDPEPDALVLQKFAPGVRHNCHIAAADGELVAYFQQKVIRTDELDDTGIGVAGAAVAPSPELRAHCEQLTRSLRYTGVGCIQFLVDGERAAFLEFNPRMDSTAVLPYRMGYDFPRLAIQLAAYRKARNAGPQSLAACLRPNALDAAYPAGRCYHWFYGDLNAWIECLRRGRQDPVQLAAWALRMLWASVTSSHLTWELSDPLPTLHMFWKKYAEMPLRRLPRAAFRHA